MLYNLIFLRVIKFRLRLTLTFDLDSYFRSFPIFLVVATGTAARRTWHTNKFAYAMQLFGESVSSQNVTTRTNSGQT